MLARANRRFDSGQEFSRRAQLNATCFGVGRHSPVHNKRMGSYHSLDIPFVLYWISARLKTSVAQERCELAHVNSAAWAAFARTGDPNHADMPHWPATNCVCALTHCVARTV